MLIKNIPLTYRPYRYLLIFENFWIRTVPHKNGAGCLCFRANPGPSFVCLGLANCPFGVKGGPLLLLHTAAPSGTRECWRWMGSNFHKNLGSVISPQAPAGRLAKASVLCWLTVSARIPSLVYLPNVCKKTHTTSSNGVHCTYLSVMKYSVNLP